jgi:dipeptidyl aminopeptidase/acylaminoacyl peptidase
LADFDLDFVDSISAVHPVHPAPVPMRPSLLLAALSVAAWLLLPAAGHGQVPPDARWETFETRHFRIHYTEGLEEVARRAADRAEVAHALLVETFVPAPRGMVDLLVADNVDFANGYATPIPTNRIVVYAQPPVDEPTLAFYDDWLQLLVTHELVHIFHMDYARGAPKALRRVFGRLPLFFPNAVVPTWTLEGLAVYYESRLTGAGRVRGTMHEMALRTAVLEDAFLPIDRVTGTPTTWPGGRGAYIYGSMFVHHLAEIHGPDAAGEFVMRMGGNVLPYRIEGVARRVFGTGFAPAWEAWRDSLTVHYLALADSLRAGGLTEPEALTTGGWVQQFPRYAPAGGRLAFARATGREEQAAMVLEEDGTLTRLTPRTGAGPAAWDRDGRGLVTAQIDAADRYRYFSDLYRVEAGRGMRRLTHRARLSAPDVHPVDGRIVAVRSGAGTNTLVVLDADGWAVRELVAPELDVHWALPRWSPDGTRIAVGRWRAGGYYDVVVLDAEGRVVRTVTETRAIDGAPAWSPDGRYLVFSSDRTGIANLYAFDVESGALRQVTNVLTGAFQPDVSPDGRWIAFSWYGADGYDIARVPFDPAAWRPAPPVRPEIRERTGDPEAVLRTAGGPARRYSPWRSLAPSYWVPTFEDRAALGTTFGVSLEGEDLVGRHRYALSGSLHPGSSRGEGSLGYLYAGLGNPVLGTSAFQRWTLLARANTLPLPAGGRVPTALLQRERSASAVATLTRPRFRSFGWVSAGGNLRDRDRIWDDAGAAGSAAVRQLPLDLGAVTTAGFSTVRRFPFSTGPEQGWLAAGTVEGRRYARAFADEVAPRGYWRTTGRGQAFQPLDLPGFARHVLALRGAGGADWGSRAPGFTAGGIYGPFTAFPLGTGLGIGSELAFPVRGYPEAAQRGNRAVSASAEYRFPLLLVERGVRLLPLFVDRFWGATFADAGGAWCEGPCEAVFGPTEDGPRPLVSVGAEVGMQLTVGYFGGLSLVGGAALPLRDYRPGDVVLRPGPSVYLRTVLPF